MKVLVCGTRRWHDRQVIADKLLALVTENDLRYPDPLIIHGAARGADRIAAEEAGKAGLITLAFPADWAKYGKRAGFVRNIEMLDQQPDLVIAFWDGVSKGTKHTIDEAVRRGIPVEIVHKSSSKEEAK